MTLRSTGSALLVSATLIQWLTSSIRHHSRTVNILLQMLGVVPEVSSQCKSREVLQEVSRDPRRVEDALAVGLVEDLGSAPCTRDVTPALTSVQRTELCIPMLSCSSSALPKKSFAIADVK